MAVDYGGDGGVEVVAVEGEEAVLIVDGAHLHQLAVEVEHLRRAGAFVQIVDVLGDDLHVEILLQVNQAEVAGVGLRVDQLVAALIIELVDERGVAAVAVGRSHIHHGVFLPEAVAIAEGADATLGAHARTGGDYKLFHRTIN